MIYGKEVEELLSKMTLEEKIAQTLSIATNDCALSEEEKKVVLETGEIQNEQIEEQLRLGLGAFQLPGKNFTVEESVKYRNILQKYIQEHTRLKIPALVHEECLNGQLAKGATIFPRPIGLAGSFNPELVEQVYDAVGREVRARGGHQAFTPVLDIGRDPRWGRIEETFGEDTHLVMQMGLAVVKGLQGGADGVKEDHIISSPKHFAAYGQCDGGRNFAPTNVPLRILRDQIFPPFEKAVKEAHAMGIMPSHAEIDGIPCHGNSWLLDEVLRKEWGFEGIVVSDYGDVERLEILHHIAENKTKAAAYGLRAGVDIDAPSGSAYSVLKEAIDEDPSLLEVLDQTVRRILSVKYRIGLFDRIYVDPDQAAELVNCQEHKEIALKAAEETVILLKNENDILPLEKEKLKRLAVIGPTADPVEFSYYSERPNVGVSILDGIRTQAAGQFDVVYEKGCNLTKEQLAMETETDATLRNPSLYTQEEEEEMIQKAVETADESDIVILCLGGSPNTSREAVTLMKHYGDNASLDLVGQQNELFKRIAATGKPVIVVLINGKPLSCGTIYEHANAVLEGWYLGEQTGTALGKILFGEINPSGKLPVTIVRNSGHLPGYYSQKSTGFINEYLFEEEGPYYWFGYGLSYTKFEYSNLEFSEKNTSEDVLLRVSADIKNVGDRAGKEAVQLYISDPVASITQPDKLLKGFRKIELQPGECKKVCFDIRKEMLMFTGKDYTRVLEPGDFVIMVGKNCKEGLEKVYTLSERK